MCYTRSLKFSFFSDINNKGLHLCVMVLTKCVHCNNYSLHCEFKWVFYISLFRHSVTELRITLCFLKTSEHINSGDFVTQNSAEMNRL